MDEERLKLFSFWIVGVFVTIATFSFFLGPAQPWFQKYSTESRLIELKGEGEAQLLKAENERKVQIEDAKGKLEAAKLHALSEIERSKGVAKANTIIGDSLKGNEAYLRYLWIQGLQDGSSEVIYIPTEAGLPILEAGKRK